MRSPITKKQINDTVNGLNKACTTLGLPAGYGVDHASSGYKLTQNNGDIWHDRTNGREFYNRVWAYRAGIEAGANKC